jgi:hypothetical protein
MASDLSGQPPDGAGVARKRRRPALACEQCRRRKIKCDRTTPCGPCQRSGLESCTYRPECFRRTTNTTSSTTVTQDSAALLLALASPVSDWQRQLPAEVPPPPAAVERPRSSAASDQSESVDLQTHPHPHPHRRMTLDDARSTVEREPQPQPQPQRRGLAPIRGCFVKSRFYGPSHFINSAGAVLHPFPRLQVQHQVGATLANLLSRLVRF